MTELHQDENSAGLETAPSDSSDQAVIKQLNALKSEDSQTRLAAVTALGALDDGNEASLRALERVAGQDDSQPVREAALQALDATVYRKLQRSAHRLTGPIRDRILAEIDRWTADGLITAHTARLLTQRYHFAEPPTPKAPEAKPDKPRPSLSELLLSETTIKVALYLGAFFVVAAAFILAAIFEVARLPILGLATLGFFGAAVALKWRLPQASFVLFIVFSFLLPIDAAVLFDLLDLSSKAEQLAWIIVTVFLMLVWVGGTLFDKSRFCSVMALVALSAAAWQLGRWFDLTPHLDMLLWVWPF
jgi:VIT1/CCC1 family predicted Fe2+/Mn2+ transporter